MKKNEIAILVLIVGIVAIASYFAVSSLLGGSKLKPVEVDKVDLITADVSAPDEGVFGGENVNKDTYNPTIKVNIGNQSNQQPFNIQQ